MVAKNQSVRYSGSPFVLGFDEANLPRYVLMVDVEFGKKAIVEKIEVPTFFKYERVSGKLKEIKEELRRYKKTDIPTFLELYYKKEDGLSINDYLAETIGNLPEGVFVVNKKPQPTNQNNNSIYFDDIDNEELKNLTPEEIFSNLILSKSNIDITGLTEKEIEKKQESLIKKYLPLFMEVAKEVEAGESYENN